MSITSNHIRQISPLRMRRYLEGDSRRWDIIERAFCAWIIAVAVVLAWLVVA